MKSYFMYSFAEEPEAYYTASKCYKSYRVKGQTCLLGLSKRLHLYTVQTCTAVSPFAQKSTLLVVLEKAIALPCNNKYHSNIFNVSLTFWHGHKNISLMPWRFGYQHFWCQNNAVHLQLPPNFYAKSHKQTLSMSEEIEKRLCPILSPSTGTDLLTVHTQSCT